MNLFLQWLGKKSVQQKLVISNLLVLILVAIPITWTMLTYEYFALRSHLLNEIRVQATIAGESTAAALAFEDKTAAFETLSVFRDSPYLLEMHLILPDGTVFQSYFKDTHKVSIVKSFEVSKVPEEIATFLTITIKKPIYLRDEFVGSIMIVNTLEVFYSRLMLYVSIVILVSFIGVVFARWMIAKTSKTITEPIVLLTKMTKKIMKEKDYNTSIPISSEDEIGSLSSSFNEMMSQIRIRDLSLRNLAYYDRVTGIANRHFFEERIVQSVHNAGQYGSNCYLLMIDLDDFKIVNDTLGHHIGDVLLKTVSQKLSAILRMDDCIFRIGGDEFAVIVEHIENEDSVKQIAQKIIESISTPVDLEGHIVKVGASIGISSFPTHSTDVITLMSTADTAMYVAKGKGKNNFSIFVG
jgi:diguanylate cyclase (GGDEF)-like protein